MERKKAEIKKILFATDFSQTSENAKELAVTMKDSLNCYLDVVHVYDPSTLVMPAPYGALPGVDQWVNDHFDSFKAKGRETLDDLCPGMGAGCSAAFLEGQPGDAIVKYAHENQIDLVIMGTHGHRGLERLLMGSVAEYVVRHCECPVLTIKSTQE